MSYITRLPASWNDMPPPRKVDIDLSSPGLAVDQLEKLLFTGKAIISHADEVWPRLYIGDQHCAENRADLNKNRITHVLSMPETLLQTYPQGKVLVHCHVGVSRSATLVLAYLMLKQNLTLVEAICLVKENRGVIPNRGFLRQLIDLNRQLNTF
uniref:Dual specificity protein phosphatase 26 n=1 Tax=Neogobius melanostomus TaxID=47308 RepID=A0A8C6V0Q2_9GOBI